MRGVLRRDRSACRAALCDRLLDAAGQTASEYLVLTGVITSVAILTLNMIGWSLRIALKKAAMQILSVVTGS